MGTAIGPCAGRRHFEPTLNAYELAEQIAGAPRAQIKENINLEKPHRNLCPLRTMAQSTGLSETTSLVPH